MKLIVSLSEIRLTINVNSITIKTLNHIKTLGIKM